jgi:hypothetical protein
MSKEADIQAIVAKARARGYFIPEDCSGLGMTLQELGQLQALLGKHGIPICRPEIAHDSPTGLTADAARRIIDTLRKGLPATEGINYYSAGRQDLMQRVDADLTTVGEKHSLVRFLDADIGQGKTHALYLLRELAFKRRFAVSVVTLSQTSCPLYDFMMVYHEIMWGLRTADQRQQPALANIIDRWVEAIGHFDKARVRHIVEHELPMGLRKIMAAYVDATNMLRPNEEKRQIILKYLAGEKMTVRDIRALQLPFRLESDNALQLLSEMASTLRHIGFAGICILFDEAEAIHSFAYAAHRDQAYANLQRIVAESRSFPHCFFIYATTPSFFSSVGGKWVAGLEDDSVMELEPLVCSERSKIGSRVAELYALAYGQETPSSARKAILLSARADRVGDYIRQTVAILDEFRTRNDGRTL